MTKFFQFVRKWLIPPGIWRFLALVGKDSSEAERLPSHEDVALLAKSEKLKDRHRGSRCFILGAGSSVSSQDIRKLRGEIVISVSNTFVHPDFSIIRPRYHVLPPLLKSHGQLHSEEKFVEWLKAMEFATDGVAMVMHIGDRQMINRHRLFLNREIYWIEYLEKWDGGLPKFINLAQLPPIWSVSELALTAAVYLGFENIYLIGIDHDWFNGIHVYFYDHAKEHVLRPDLSDLGFADSEFQMRRHAEIFKKYKYLNAINRNIFNANANEQHYLDVFPKISFDALFDQPK